MTFQHHLEHQRRVVSGLERDVEANQRSLESARAMLARMEEQAANQLTDTFDVGTYLIFEPPPPSGKASGFQRRSRMYRKVETHSNQPADRCWLNERGDFMTWGQVLDSTGGAPYGYGGQESEVWRVVEMEKVSDSPQAPESPALATDVVDVNRKV